MRPNILDLLSRHQFLLTSVVIGLFLVGSAFFTTNFLKNQGASITAASCYLQSEVNAKESELANLNGQASSIQNEMLQLEQSIISLSSTQTTDGYTIDTLKAEIRSDYDMSQEEKRMKWICDAENRVGTDFTASSDTPSCSDVTAYYNSIKSNNEYKKTLLANLEAQSGSSNMAYLTSTISERRSTLQNLTDVQIPELTQLIGLYKSNICPDKELVCDDGLDNDRDGAVDCEDTDCAGAASCTGLTVDTGTYGDPEVDDADGAKNPEPPNDDPNLPLPTGGGIGTDGSGLFPVGSYPSCDIYESGLMPLEDERNSLEAEQARLSQAMADMQTELDNLNPTSFTYNVEADYLNNRLVELGIQASSNLQALAAKEAAIAALRVEIQQCLAQKN